MEPTFILMENVPGMSTGVGKEIFRKVVEKLEKNYHVEYDTLNAADYGVPQIRKRLVLHGIRNDVYYNLGLDKVKTGILPLPTHSKDKKQGYKKWVTVWKAISDLPILEAGACCNDGTIKNHRARNLSETNIERLQEKPKQQDRGGSADQRRTEERYAVVGSNEAGRHGVVLL